MPSDSERKVIMTDEEMMEMVDLYRIAMLYRGTATTQLRREGRDMSQIYPVHLGERDKYHVVEYPQGYSGLIRPDGSEVTSLTEPEDIHWHRELKPIHDELNNLHQQLATITRQRDLAVSALKQSREALRLPCDRWNKTQFEIVQSAIASIDSAIKESEV